MRQILTDPAKAPDIAADALGLPVAGPMFSLAQSFRARFRPCCNRSREHNIRR